MRGEIKHLVRQNFKTFKITLKSHETVFIFGTDNSLYRRRKSNKLDLKINAGFVFEAHAYFCRFFL